MNLESAIDQVREEAKESGIAKATVKGLKDEGVSDSAAVLKVNILNLKYYWNSLLLFISIFLVPMFIAPKNLCGGLTMLNQGYVGRRHYKAPQIWDHTMTWITCCKRLLELPADQMSCASY